MGSQKLRFVAANNDNHIVPHRVLVAEDDTMFRFLLTSALRKDGYHVFSVANGMKLLSILRGSICPGEPLTPFNLVLCDLHLSGRRELETLTTIGKNPGMPPVILFTVFADEPTRKRALEIGALTLPDRPFDVDYLREVVARVLN